MGVRVSVTACVFLPFGFETTSEIKSTSAKTTMGRVRVASRVMIRAFSWFSIFSRDPSTTDKKTLVVQYSRFSPNANIKTLERPRQKRENRLIAPRIANRFWCRDPNPNVKIAVFVRLVVRIVCCCSIIMSARLSHLVKRTNYLLTRSASF